MTKEGRGKGSKTGRLVPFRGGPFVKLRALRCYQEVHEKIVDGWPLSEVARFIQQTNEEYTEITKEGLISILSKYKATIPAAELAGRALTPTQIQAAEKVQEALNELEEMAELFRLQKRRVMKTEALEQKIGMPVPSLQQDIRIAKELLESSARLKQDLGITEKHLGTLKTENLVASAEIGNPAVRKVLEDPQARRRLMGVAQRLLLAADKRKDDEIEIRPMSEDSS